MLNLRELATVLAALRFWQEEMCPHDPSIMRPYLLAVGFGGIDPLTEFEIVDLVQRLRNSCPTDNSFDPAEPSS